ncbi:TonB-dependent receptor [Pedobacter nototheniae]|uniref:TonB-dependent receptor n=1 Tax=Pedobacter nototheniae TaxID=2488994 RepID=UPI00103E2B35|nr:TonB-dependent receptor [Pedobacter nototheniae]
MDLLNSFKRAALTVFALTISVLSYAQTGKISGKITDNKTGETLIGVTVKISGTTKGASTDVEGRYIIPSLIPGKYIVEVSYVGYASKSISDVEVKVNNATTLDVVMVEAGSQNLSDVVIRGNASKESINTLYANQKSSISISSGISAELIRKSPDRNTSEVLKRVSGASIQDNKFVIVRGLSDRYNSAMLNNSMLPNTEVDKRAFSFDILPSNLIDAIVINKTASADIPADFSGGVVQVTTKDFPDNKFLNLSLGTSYNFQSAFKDFLSAPKGGNEIFGFYDKGRDIPSSFPSTKEYQALPNGSPETFTLSKQFTNNWGYNSDKSTLGPIFQANYGNSKVFENNSKFGTVLSLTYRYDERLKTSEQKAYVGQSLGDQFHDDMYSFNTNIGALANFAYSWGNNKISLKNLYNRILENQFTYRVGVDDAGGQFIRTGDYLLQRSLLTNQLAGEHLLSTLSKIKLDWNVNYANTDRKEPGYKRMDYSKDGIASVQTGSAVAALAGNFNSVLNENSYGAAANVTIPVTWFRENNKFKVGYFGQYRDRDFSARVIGFIRNGNFDNSLLTFPQDKIFSPENIRPNGFVLNEITNGSDQYQATAFLNAGYIMFDGYLTEKLRLGIGARLESYKLSLKSEDNGKPVNVDSTAVNLLPSANLIYNISDKANLRLSGSQTVGRAEFRELAPFPFYDFNKNVNVRGNAGLKQSKTTNIDLGYAIYPSSGETFSVSAFYKYFDLPIEQTLQLGTSGRSLSYANSKSATVYGLEMEFRKSLKFIDESLSNLTFNTNASWIKSKVKVSKLVNATGSRPLQGQSPYLINAGLSYNSKKQNSTGATLLYNRVGPRIWAIGNVEDPDIYEYSRNILDFQVSQKFAKSRAEIKLNYSDIFNNEAIFYQKVKGSDPDASFDRKTDNINISDRFGSTISLSLSYKFF